MLHDVARLFCCYAVQKNALTDAKLMPLTLYNSNIDFSLFPSWRCWSFVRRKQNYVKHVFSICIHSIHSCRPAVLSSPGLQNLAISADGGIAQGALAKQAGSRQHRDEEEQFLY